MVAVRLHKKKRVFGIEVRIFMRGNENNIKMYIEAYENLG
jgi:hypothetical protein